MPAACCNAPWHKMGCAVHSYNNPCFHRLTALPPRLHPTLTQPQFFTRRASSASKACPPRRASALRRRWRPTPLPMRPYWQPASGVSAAAGGRFMRTFFAIWRGQQTSGRRTLVRSKARGRLTPPAPPVPAPRPAGKVGAHKLVEDANGDLVPAYVKGGKMGGEADGRRCCCCCWICAAEGQGDVWLDPAQLQCRPSKLPCWACAATGSRAYLNACLRACSVLNQPAPLPHMRPCPLPLAAHTLVEDANGDLVPAYVKAGKMDGGADGRCCCCCTPTMRCYCDCGAASGRERSSCHRTAAES